MKIAFLYPDFYKPSSGTGLYARGLVREFAKERGIDIHVLTADTKDTHKKELFEDSFGETVTIHTVCRPMDSLLSPLAYRIAVAKRFPELHRKYAFDIIHAGNLVHLADIILKLKKIDIPMVTTAHTTIGDHVRGLLQSTWNPFSLSPRERLDIFAFPFLVLAQRYYLRHTRHLITPSAVFKEYLIRHYRFKGDIRVIHNAIDAGYYNLHTITDKKCHQRFPHIKGFKHPVILYSGKLIPQKGIVLFLRALKKIENLGLRPTVFITGQGKESHLKNYIKKSGVDPANLHFFGFLPDEDLAYLYKLSDIFVLPSYFEHFPVSLLEAMSMECCPIASDVGSVAEIIDHEENGLIFRSGDLDSLVSSLTWLLKNLSRAKKMGREGRQKVHTLFSADQMALKTKSFYDEIIGEAG